MRKSNVSNWSFHISLRADFLWSSKFANENLVLSFFQYEVVSAKFDVAL